MSETGSQWEIMFEQHLEKMMRQLPKKPLQQISQAILGLAQDPRPSEGKPLIGHDNLYAMQVADWRISYAVEDNKQTVIIVGLEPIKTDEPGPENKNNLANVSDASLKETDSVVVGLKIGKDKRYVEITLSNAVYLSHLDQEIEAIINKVTDLGRADLYLPLLVAASELMTKLRDPMLGNVIYLGCYDLIQATFLPEVDLRPDNGPERGVSWKHAKIFRQDGKIFIEDLKDWFWKFKHPDKEHITSVNGKRLLSHEPEILRDGDQLHLGQLSIEVSIKQSEA